MGEEQHAASVLITAYLNTLKMEAVSSPKRSYPPRAMSHKTRSSIALFSHVYLRYRLYELNAICSVCRCPMQTASLIHVSRSLRNAVCPYPILPSIHYSSTAPNGKQCCTNVIRQWMVTYTSICCMSRVDGILVVGCYTQRLRRVQGVANCHVSGCQY